MNKTKINKKDNNISCYVAELKQIAHNKINGATELMINRKSIPSKYDPEAEVSGIVSDLKSFLKASRYNNQQKPSSKAGVDVRSSSNPQGGRAKIGNISYILPVERIYGANRKETRRHHSVLRSQDISKPIAPLNMSQQYKNGIYSDKSPYANQNAVYKRPHVPGATSKIMVEIRSKKYH